METPQLIGGFKQRFEKFVLRYKALQLENQKLKSRIEELSLQVDEKEEEIKAIKSTGKTTELANAFLYKGEDTQSAKQNINRIVREIDNCIALLNR